MEAISERRKELPPVPDFAEEEAPKLSQISDFAEPSPIKEDENQVGREE